MEGRRRRAGGRKEGGREEGGRNGKQKDCILRMMLLYRVFIKYCVFSEDFKIFRTPFPVFPLCQFMYTHQTGRTPALQQNWKKNHILRKNTIFNEHPVYACSIFTVPLYHSLEPLHRCKRPSNLSTQCECTVTPIGW